MSRSRHVGPVRAERRRGPHRATPKTIYEIFADRPASREILKPTDEDHGAVAVELLYDDPHHVRLPRPDAELVDRCLALHDLTQTPVHFVSFDTGAVLRAITAGLPSRRLQYDD